MIRKRVRWVYDGKSPRLVEEAEEMGPGRAVARRFLSLGSGPIDAVRQTAVIGERRSAISPGKHMETTGEWPIPRWIRPGARCRVGGVSGVVEEVSLARMRAVVLGEGGELLEVSPKQLRRIPDGEAA